MTFWDWADRHWLVTGCAIVMLISRIPLVSWRRVVTKQERLP